MSIGGWTALLVAVAGVITALTALYRQWQSDRLVQQHVQAHARDVHPPSDPAVKP